MVRANKHMHIALSPLHLSPNNYMSRMKPQLEKPKEKAPVIKAKSKSPKKEDPKPKAEQKDDDIDFNKITTLNFKTLTGDEVESTMKKEINDLEDDFKKMGLIDTNDKFIAAKESSPNTQSDIKKVPEKQVKNDETTKNTNKLE